MIASVLSLPRPAWTFAALIALGLATAPIPASAQGAGDVGALTQKVERLQRELNTLQRQVYSGSSDGAQSSGQTAPSTSSGGQAMPPAAAQRLNERLSNLEQEVQRLTGRMEEAQYGIRQLGNRMDKLAKDVDFRLSELEKRVGASQVSQADQAGQGETASAQTEEGASQDQSASDTQTAADSSAPSSASGQQDNAAADGSASSGDGVQTLGTVSEQAVEEVRNQQAESENTSGAGETQTARADATSSYELPDGSPEEQYDHAFGILRQANYEQAEKALGAFLDAHPDHELSGNAKYWLGETYYVRGNYDQAAVTFAEGFQNYPESQKAPDNLLKLGMSLAQIDRTEDACGIFSELLNRYPDAANNIQQRAKRERQRLSCGN